MFVSLFVVVVLTPRLSALFPPSPLSQQSVQVFVGEPVARVHAGCLHAFLPATKALPTSYLRTVCAAALRRRGGAGRWLGDLHVLSVESVVGPPYAVLDVEPKQGPITGGTTLAIVGLDFVSTEATVIRWVLCVWFHARVRGGGGGGGGGGRRRGGRLDAIAAAPPPLRFAGVLCLACASHRQVMFLGVSWCGVLRVPCVVRVMHSFGNKKVWKDVVGYYQSDTELTCDTPNFEAFGPGTIDIRCAAPFAAERVPLPLLRGCPSPRLQTAVSLGGAPS